jgi:hypothetical protein
MLGHVAFWMETIEPVVAGMYRGQPIADQDWYGGDELGLAPGADRRSLDKVMDGSAAHFAMHLPEVREAG